MERNRESLDGRGKLYILPPVPMTQQTQQPDLAGEVYRRLHAQAIMSTPTSSASSAGAAALLRRQLKQMQTSTDIPGISCGLVNDSNIFEWEVMLMISDDVKYYGGKLLVCLEAVSES